MSTNLCIANTLKLINVLQNNSRNLCNYDCSCTKPFLGPSISMVCYNTRVITLYSKDGSLISYDYIDNDEILTSSTFRVQNIDGNCCTLLILKFSNGVYSSTGQTVTVDLNCICAIKCLEDVVVNNI